MFATLWVNTVMCVSSISKRLKLTELSTRATTTPNKADTATKYKLSL